MPTYLRMDQAAISVPLISNVPTLPYVVSWTTLEGGDLESEDTKTRPGGMQPQVNLGGPTTRTDATVTRPYTNELHPFVKPLEDAAGNSAMSISWVILDSTGARPSSAPVITLHGILKNVTRPNWDANATGTAFLSLVMGCNVDASVSTSL